MTERALAVIPIALPCPAMADIAWGDVPGWAAVAIAALSTARTSVRILDPVRNKLPSPPIVALPAPGDSEPVVAYLLAWEQHERDGAWWAWVTWPRIRGGRAYRHVTTVRAAAVRRIEEADVYANVPRRVLGSDGVYRPWQPPADRPHR